MGGIIDTAATPKETSISQIEARLNKMKSERRSDQISVSMKTSARSQIEDLTEVNIVPIVELAIANYAKHW